MNGSYIKKSINNTDIFAYSKCDSTNIQAELLKSDGAIAPFFVVSDSQQSGTGDRPGSTWDSPISSIYLTAILKNFNVEKFEQCCRGISNYLNTLSGKLNIFVDKNHFKQGDKKLGGCMCFVDLNTRLWTIGLGLNINTLIKDHDQRLHNSITSLRIITDQEFNLPEIQEEIIKIIIDS